MMSQLKKNLRLFLNQLSYLLVAPNHLVEPLALGHEYIHTLKHNLCYFVVVLLDLSLLLMLLLRLLIFRLCPIFLDFLGLNLFLLGSHHFPEEREVNFEENESDFLVPWSDHGSHSVQIGNSVIYVGIFRPGPCNEQLDLSHNDFSHVFVGLCKLQEDEYGVALNFLALVTELVDYDRKDEVF